MKMTIVPSEEPVILGGVGGCQKGEVEKTGTVGRGRVISGPVSPGCFSLEDSLPRSSVLISVCQGEWGLSTLWGILADPK